MQRFSSLITLILFMAMLSWVAQAFQQDPHTFRARPGNEPLNSRSPEPGNELIPERITLPHRNGESLAEPGEAESSIDFLPSKNDELRLNNPPPATSKESHPRHPTGDCIHFLLLGRAWDSEMVDLIMMVTLTRGSHSLLTAVDPAFPAELKGVAVPLGELLQRGGGYDDLCRSASVITGLEPQFYIDLNIYGFAAMLDILGGINSEVYSTLTGAASPVELSAGDLDGAGLLHLLADPNMSRADKELLLIALLITARDIQHTTLGLSLLWTGYRNIHTNLGLSDLLEVRRVTQEISPTRVSYKEIKAPGP